MAASTLDIILPCYNPQKNWEDQLIQSYKEICKALPFIKIQLILVNDGSNTGINTLCIEKIKSLIPLFQFVTYPKNKGKGFALRQGMKNSTAEIVMYTDIDFPYTTESFLQVFDVMYQNSCVIAAGVKDKNYYTQTPFIRKLISRFLRLVSRFCFRIKITDTQCGLKGMNEKGKTLFLQTRINRYLFDLEFIFLASRKSEVSILPVEIHLRENVQFSSTPYTILFTETGNFLKIFLRSIFTGKE